MDNAIMLDYNPFTMDSLLIVYKDGNKEYSKASSKIEDAIISAFELANKYNINDIKIYGPFGIAEQAKEQLAKYYNNTNITIEGI